MVGDFNSWDGRLHPMRSLGSSGIWELFLPEVAAGARYKFEIVTADGELTLKADPYALETEVPPRTASVVSQSHHKWSKDDARGWSAGPSSRRCAEPVSIYEVHLGSWRAEHDGRTTARSPTSSWPTSCPPTSPTWASPTSSCCR